MAGYDYPTNSKNIALLPVPHCNWAAALGFPELPVSQCRVAKSLALVFSPTCVVIFGSLFLKPHRILTSETHCWQDWTQRIAPPLFWKPYENGLLNPCSTRPHSAGDAGAFRARAVAPTAAVSSRVDCFLGGLFVSDLSLHFLGLLGLGERLEATKV